MTGANKIALIGGGGLRTPLLIYGLAEARSAIGVREVALYDIDAHRSELMANLDGACYQRTLRAETKMLYKPDEQFEVGGFKVLREGKDVTLVAAGYMVHECLAAADQLSKNGRRATVIDAYSMPLKTDELLQIALGH